MPEISVLMPIYNHEKYVSEAIQSVLSQTFGDIELVVLNNGSTDGSGEIAQEFALADDRVKLLNEEKNITAYWGVEKCFENSVGRYVAFMGSDDIWEISKLEKQYDFLNKNDEYGMVFTETRMINGDGDDLGWTPFHSAEKNMSRTDWLREFFFQPNGVCWSSCVMDRALKPTSSYADARFRQLGDLYMWVRALKKRGLYIYPESLTRYRQHGENESHKSVDELHNRSYLEWVYIFKEYLDLSLEETLVVFPEIGKNSDLSLSNKNYYLSLLAHNAFIDSQNIKSRRLFSLLAVFDMFGDEDVAQSVVGGDKSRMEEFYVLTGDEICMSHRHSSVSNVGVSEIADAGEGGEVSILNNVRGSVLAKELYKRIMRKFGLASA